MGYENFNTWIDRFLKEKEIDKYEMFTIERNGTKHIFEIGHIVDTMKITSKQEQNAIKDMLVKIDFLNGDVRDYIKHLANALVDTYSRVESEDIEDETM